MLACKKSQILYIQTTFPKKNIFKDRNKSPQISNKISGEHNLVHKKFLYPTEPLIDRHIMQWVSKL